MHKYELDVEILKINACHSAPRHRLLSRHKAILEAALCLVFKWNECKYYEGVKTN